LFQRSTTSRPQIIPTSATFQEVERSARVKG
jgi:hypothetical protein